MPNYILVIPLPPRLATRRKAQAETGVRERAVRPPKLSNASWRAPMALSLGVPYRRSARAFLEFRVDR